MDNRFSYMHDIIDTVLSVRFTDLEKERTCCEELLKCSAQHGYVYARAFAYTYLGDYYLAQNDAMNSGKFLYEAKQLCSKNVYPTLYMKLCHLLGFYYHLINDEQNALQYYLESIALAEDLGDVYQVCNAWNNIADMFQGHKQYEEAVNYYIKAYDAMCEKKLNDTRLYIIVLYNLAEMNGYLNELANMQMYLERCEEITSEQTGDTSFYMLCCKTGRFLLAAFQKDIQSAKVAAKEILDANFYSVEDHYILTEFILQITQALVHLKEEYYARCYLDILEEYSSMNEISFTQRLVELRVLYAETFSTGIMLDQSYKEYCQTMRKIITLEDDVRVSGMNAKINLQKVMQEHENMLEKNKRLENEVNIDDLTNLYNRRYFNQLFEQENVSYASWGIIMVDVDYFKEYNDAYGHIHGDLVLRTIGDILKSHSSDAIVPCRYGGDEFSCVCMNQSNEDIEAYIQKVRTDLQEHQLEHKHSLCSEQITLSIGFENRMKPNELDAQVVLNHADEALYHTKTKGRNGWTRYEIEEKTQYHAL